MSHLLQMRGLKRFTFLLAEFNSGVASFTDAWIETSPESIEKKLEASHLLQMRGLKLIFVVVNNT